MRSSTVDELLKRLMDSVIDLSGADKGFLILFENGTPAVHVARNIAQEDLDNALAELSDSILEKSSTSAKR